MEHGWNWWSLLGLHHNLHIASAVLVAVVVLVLAGIAGAHFRKLEAAIVPPGKLSVAGLFDFALGGLLNYMETLIGHQFRQFFTLCGTLALFILCSNLMGLIPGMLPPTSAISTTLGCALLVFCYYNFQGLREHGVLKYLQHLSGPFWWLAPLMFPVELISHLARPVSLSFRLFGNIFADHLVLGIFLGLVPWFLPIPIMALGLLVAFVQTAIFVILTMVYLSMAVAHEEH